MNWFEKYSQGNYFPEEESGLGTYVHNMMVYLNALEETMMEVKEIDKKPEILVSLSNVDKKFESLFNKQLIVPMLRVVALEAKNIPWGKEKNPEKRKKFIDKIRNVLRKAANIMKEIYQKYEEVINDKKYNLQNIPKIKEKSDEIFRIIDPRSVKMASRIGEIPGLISDNIVQNYLVHLQNFLKSEINPENIDFKEMFYKKIPELPEEQLKEMTKEQVQAYLSNMGVAQAILDIIKKLYNARINPKDSLFDPRDLFVFLTKTSNWVTQLDSDYKDKIKEMGLPDFKILYDNIVRLTKQANSATPE